MPVEQFDKNDKHSRMGPDLWNFFQYVIRMNILEDEHKACFTGTGAGASCAVSVPMNDWIRLVNLETKYKALEAILEDVLKKEKPLADPELRDHIMGLRLQQGSSTTLRSFFNAVGRYEDIYARGNRHHGKENFVIGYTLDEKDLNNLAGDKAEGFKWIWEPGNYLLTSEGKIYLFL